MIKLLCILDCELWMCGIFFFLNGLQYRILSIWNILKKKNIYHLIQNGSTVAVCVCVCSYVFVL